MHEHLYMDASPALSVHGYLGDDELAGFDVTAAAECRWNPGAHPDNYRLTDVGSVIDDLELAKAAGVSAVVELTPIDLGRSVGHLQAISLATNLHIVMGTGYYLGVTHRRHLPDGAEEDAVFNRIMHEHSYGIEETEVRPGIIGEIGTGDPVDSSELAVLRGSARAASETGLALSVHVHPWGWRAYEVLDEITKVGTDLGRVVFGHMNTAITRPQYLRGLLRSGVTLGFDLFGFDHSLLGVGRYPPSEWDVARMIVGLVQEGFADQIVLSQDVGVQTRLTKFGGWGYAHLARHVVPLLLDLGASQEEVDQMTVGNCRSLLGISQPT